MKSEMNDSSLVQLMRFEWRRGNQTDTITISTVPGNSVRREPRKKANTKAEQEDNRNCNCMIYDHLPTLLPLSTVAAP